jgi:uncharacterized protein (TIGR00369 family)
MPDDRTLEEWNTIGTTTLPGYLGVRFITIEKGRLVAELLIREPLLSPNGYLHAGTVVSLADTACGYGAWSNLPNGAENFTTIELKSNFLSTAREGTLRCVATMMHGGRTTQVWDAVVEHVETGKQLALFRCTQMILYPR